MVVVMVVVVFPKWTEGWILTFVALYTLFQHILPPFFLFGLLSAWLKISINSVLMVINSFGSVYTQHSCKNRVEISVQFFKNGDKCVSLRYIWDIKN